MPALNGPTLQQILKNFQLISKLAVLIKLAFSIAKIAIKPISYMMTLNNFQAQHSKLL